jgi:peptidyl-prolyl cis-trans isomerase B (cyclophilin B)
LLAGKDKAADITASVMTEGYAAAAAAGVDELGYARFVLKEAASRCAKLVLDGNAPQTDNTTPKTKYVPSAAVFNGSVEDGMEQMTAVLDTLDAYPRFAYVAATAGRLTAAEIGEAMGQREAVARYCLEVANYAATRAASSAVRSDQVISLFKKYAEEQALPTVVSAACEQYIAQNQKKDVSFLKWLIPAATAAVACIVLVVLWATGVFGNRFTSTSGDGSGNKKPITNADVKEELSIDVTKVYYADIDIKDYGTITLKLEPQSAPITVNNFVELANKGFYDGLTFHRIIADFMMQGGDPQGTGMGGSDKEIVGEFTNNGYDNPLKHTRGAISMARSNDPNSASSQFFIVHQTSPHLDGSYAVFGYVTEGIDVVDAVCEDARPIDGNGSIARSEQPVITSVKIRMP